MTEPTGSIPSAGIAPPGYRMTPQMRIDGVRLQVDSLERSLGYYERVLGLRLLHRDGGSASLGVAGATSAIVELSERAGAAPVPPHGRLGLYHFAILLPDRPALGRFVSHLARIGARAGASDHFVSEALYLTDPDGLGIEVYADRPREDWRTRGRELVMATEPLDLAAVAASGKGEPWTGMPAGTSIGHVHLHVGDLEVASGFYHRALGLDRMVWSYPQALFLAAGGYHHHLGLNTWAGAGARPAGEGDARLLEWRVALPASDDVAATEESLRGAGFGVRREGEDVVATDPWGTPLRLMRAR